MKHTLLIRFAVGHASLYFFARLPMAVISSGVLGKPTIPRPIWLWVPTNIKVTWKPTSASKDRYFLIGKDTASRSFPYVIPGPADEWGGTWSTAGWRTHHSNILFGLDNISGTRAPGS